MVRALKAKFRTYYNDDYEQWSDPGTKTEPVYQLFYDESGNPELKVVGQRDLVSEINSHAAEVDLDLILEQFTAGDYNALEKRKGFYADVSSMPENLAEVMNINLRGKQLFDELPKEAKELYGNNYLGFLANPSQLSTLNSVDNLDNIDDVSVKDVPVKEVKENVES